MAEQNIIPSMKAAGRFEAYEPFSRVVDPAVFYSVEAIRTIPEMQGLKINVFSRVFEPLGVTEEMYNTMLAAALTDGAMVISLIPRFGAPVYVLSTHLKSFPLTDGYSYERMVIVTDLGPLPPEMKESLTQCQDHFREYVLNQYGVDSKVQLGTIPVLGYLSKVEHDTAEQTRKGKITDSSNSVATIRDLEAKLVAKDAYIKELEAQLGVAPRP